MSAEETNEVRLYAFARKSAVGGAYLMDGVSIKDALQKLEERSGMRFIMGTPVRGNESELCDGRFLKATK